MSESQEYFDSPDLPLLFMRSFVDEAGDPLFTEEDRTELAAMQPGYAFTLRIAIDTFNGFTKETDAETELKNS